MPGRTLILSVGYQPLCIVTSQRALVLVLSGKAELVDEDPEVLFRSTSVTFAEPLVVRLVTYVKIPYSNTAALSRRAVFARDNYRCQYCGTGKAPLTVDHLVARSRGGRWTWQNLVAACLECNSKKSDKTLEELGWTLLNEPKAPQGSLWRIISFRTPDPRWEQWLS